MSEGDTTTGISRRTALRTVAGAAGGTVAAAGAGQVAAQSSGPDFGGWFDNVSNFDGVVDRTGQQRVTVEVGVKGNTGNLAFGPPAVRVDPGTTVVWKWTGKGGGHNVVASDGSFDSGSLVSEAGHTFEHTFDSAGTYKYYCEPHKMLGMKGAIVVGGTGKQGGGQQGGGGKPKYGDWFSNVSNFSKTVDKRGQKRVTVKVGAPGNTGNLAFAPPAIHVDPGTTVVWKWTGKGGGHNVVAQDGTFDSGSLVSEAGHTFEYTFENDGIYRYYCEPHKMLGMKGAVVVGDEYPSTGGGGGGTQRRAPTGVTPGLVAFTGTLFVMFASPILYHAYLDRKYPDGVPARPEEYERERTPATEAPLEDDDQVEELGHDEFSPFGTLSLVLVYLLILVGMWVFMYFVEFLGNGPTVIG